MQGDETFSDRPHIPLRTPLEDADVAQLHSGDAVMISGIIYGARDAAHERMAALLERAEPLPFDVKGQVIYYVGPTPARPGFPIGSAGPTTASRMDRYTPALLAAGLRGMIGKGVRSAAVREAIRQYRAVYFGAVEGAAALLASTVLRADVIAYPDLGPEAIYRLEVRDFPALVIHDIYGGDLYEEGRLRYCKHDPISTQGESREQST
jgi:fumarate hydratase subunit beta